MILNEFSQVTHYHRQSAIRLLHRGNQHRTGKRRKCRRLYGTIITGALRTAWEATDCLCSKRLHPFLPELVHALMRHGDRTMSTEIEVQLCRMSTSKIDRLLRPWRRFGGRCSFTIIKPATLLKSSTPIHTFADWQRIDLASLR